MGLRNFSILESKNTGSTLVNVLKEELSDGSYGYSVKIGQIDDDHVILDCPSITDAYEIFNSIIDHAC